MHACKRFLLLTALGATVLLPASPARAGTGAIAVRPRYSAHERALLAIQEDAVARVEALATRLRGMPDGAAREALERQALEIKQQSERDVERARADFARTRGDLTPALPAEPPVAPAGAEPSKPVPTAIPAALAGCVDDDDEPNDACGSATSMVAGNYPGLASATGNDDWYEVDVQRNGTLTVTLTFIHAGGDIDVRLFDACPGVQLGASTGTTNTETITYKNTGATRTLYVRVYMFSGACNGYTMNLAIAGADDLTSADMPAGWSVPIAPRSDATATLGSVGYSNTLPGNAAGSYLNANTHVIGPDHVPAVGNGLFLDDSLLETQSILDDSPAGFYGVINRGPYTVRGGWHTVRYSVDLPKQLAETSESDNDYASQWIWSPLAASNKVPTVRPAPPIKGTGIHRNGDGLSFARSSSHAWVVSEAPQNGGGDDYDLFVYGDYQNSTTGFSVEAGNSQASGNHTDFVVGHYYQTPQTVYPSIVRFSVAGGGGPAITDQSDSQARTADLVSNPSIAWPSVTMGANRLADVFEIKMNAGVTYYFLFHRLTGSAPCAFRVYPGTSGGVYNVTGGTPSVTNGGAEMLSFTAVTSGWAPVVVYRISGSDLAPLTYDLDVSTSALADAGEKDAGAELSFSGAVPNPIHGRGEFRFALPRAGAATLGVYDVTGRRVRELVHGSLGAGSHAIAWDGDGTGGTRVGAGVYWARLEFEGRTLSRRIALLP